jgi:hypothetical protein
MGDDGRWPWAPQKAARVFLQGRPAAHVTLTCTVRARLSPGEAQDLANLLGEHAERWMERRHDERAAIEDSTEEGE